MKNTTPMFPGFHLQTLRRKPRSAQQKLADELTRLKQKSFKQIGELFERFVPRSLLKPAQTGVMSRRRIFSKDKGSSRRLTFCCNKPPFNYRNSLLKRFIYRQLFSGKHSPY